MSVRRGALQGRGRARQRPHLPLPQLPEGNGIAVLRPGLVRPEGACDRRRNRQLRLVGAALAGVLYTLRHPAVLLARGWHHGRCRFGCFRRPQRLRPDRTHLGQRENNLGDARGWFTAISAAGSGLTLLCDSVVVSSTSP